MVSTTGSPPRLRQTVLFPTRLYASFERQHNTPKVGADSAVSQAEIKACGGRPPVLLEAMVGVRVIPFTMRTHKQQQLALINRGHIEFFFFRGGRRDFFLFILVAHRYQRHTL